jgi:hypothetical protein
MTTHGLTIREGQFATYQYFNPTSPTNQSPPRPGSLPAPKPIYDMIVVQPRPKDVGYESNVATNSANENPTFFEAINGPDKEEWIKALKSEIDSIRTNETWRLVKLPCSRKPISVKWVLDLKRDAKGNIIKHKARLVA